MALPLSSHSRVLFESHLLWVYQLDLRTPFGFEFIRSRRKTFKTGIGMPKGSVAFELGMIRIKMVPLRHTKE